MTTHLRKPSGRSPLRRALPRVQPIWIIRGFLLIPLTLTFFVLAPTARAQVSPAPDGGYPNQNTAEGEDALFSLAINGVRNTAIGFNALFANTGGGANTAVGASALANNTANDNTACGSYALANNETGSGNTAIGIDALMLNIDGGLNTATGRDTLFNNTSGNNNTANGDATLFSNTTGYNNTANGRQALYGNTTGYNNTANGRQALYSNTTGYYNAANGFQALYSNTAGTGNTAEAFRALFHNTGSNNIGLGLEAGFNLTTGSGNVCIGQGVFGVAGESNTTRIRNVYGSVASGRAVYVNSDNKIGTLVSSRRFKNEIKLMDKASEAILALKPVTFRYKKEIEPNGAIMFGLIAEEVDKVDPDLVTRNDKGEVETVRYEAVNAMLLNEFLKQHRKVEAQEATIAQLKQDFQSRLAEQEKQIKALTSGLEKVNNQLELSKRAPQIVDNDK